MSSSTNANRRRVGAFARVMLAVYLLTAACGAGYVAHALHGFPDQLPSLARTSDPNPWLEVERLRSRVAHEIPLAAEWLAPMGLFDFDDRVRAVVDPNRWQLENTALTERLQRLGDSVSSIRAYYFDAASLLVVIYGAGLIFVPLAWWRPNLGSAVVLCLGPLFATPIATEPLIGVDNMHLFYLTLPMLICGGSVLLIESIYAIDRTLDGPRSEAWSRVWMGLAMILAGGAASAVGFALSELMNAGSFVVAVAPVIYGVFSVLWGVVGLLRR